MVRTLSHMMIINVFIANFLLVVIVRCTLPLVLLVTFKVKEHGVICFIVYDLACQDRISLLSRHNFKIRKNATLHTIHTISEFNCMFT